MATAAAEPVVEEVEEMDLGRPDPRDLRDLNTDPVDAISITQRKFSCSDSPILFKRFRLTFCLCHKLATLLGFVTRFVLRIFQFSFSTVSKNALETMHSFPL